ncbi:ogr/Delta-like zinc finger family protein [Burkholderia dolosa]|nr:ogr/Delta-like zinc finger family protein [Burkholderia dolosa]
MRFSMKCPHCGGRGVARAIQRLNDRTPTWIIDFQCDSVVCGHTYRTQLQLASSPRYGDLLGRSKVSQIEADRAQQAANVSK